MRCSLVLCVAALVGISTAGWQYGGARYSGQQMPVSYYLPSKMYTGHQQMYVPQYYQPQVAAAYPVRQTPAYQVRPMVVSNQVEEVPIINVDMDFNPTFTHPGAMHGDATQSSFASRSGSVSSADSCTADKLKTEAAVRANLKTLTNINNANFTSLEMEKIFGQEFQSRGRCNWFSGMKCASSIGWAVPSCVTTVNIVNCVRKLIGAGNTCVDCVCWVVEKAGFSC